MSFFFLLPFSFTKLENRRTEQILLGEGRKEIGSSLREVRG
jgi:hypothetical protein